jgi:hypothetical protein
MDLFANFWFNEIQIKITQSGVPTVGQKAGRLATYNKKGEV